MDIRKHWKVIVLLVALAVQGIVINLLIDGGCDNVSLQIAGGEVPEPGSILLFALGSLWIRRENHKNRKKLKH